MNEATHAEPRYARIFWVLLILTILEITVANLHIYRPVMIFSLVLLAIVKASLVALFYMHLKFEKLFLYILMAIPLTLSIVLILLVMLDVPR